MPATINLPYTKQAEHNLARPIIEAALGIGISTGVMTLLKHHDVNIFLFICKRCHC